MNQLIAPSPYFEKVAAHVQELQKAGAVTTITPFNVASKEQADLVFGGRRFLVTANDEGYRRYAELLRNAGVPYVSPSERYSTEDVVVGAIPRDARTLPQIIRGHQSERGGLRSTDVFYLAGNTLGKIATAESAIPRAGDISLGKMLVIREEEKVLLVPPLHFEGVDAEGVTRVLEAVQDQLFPEYERFGAVALLQSFERGLES
jgi:hypothetical protein